MRATRQRVLCVPKPHLLDTEFGPPSWHLVSTESGVAAGSSASSVWCTPPSTSTQQLSRQSPAEFSTLRPHASFVVTSRVLLEHSSHWLP